MNKQLLFASTCLFFIFLLCTSVTQAQETITSVGSGDWLDPSTWDQGRIPQDDDIILIESGHVVEISGDGITLDNVQMVIQGELLMDDEITGYVGPFPIYSDPSLTLTGSNSGMYVDGGTINEEVRSSGELLSYIQIDGTYVWSACTTGLCQIAANAIADPDPEYFGDASGTFGLPAGFVNPLPIELVSFIGEFQNGNANLTWKTASEINNSGFELQRSWDGMEFETLTLIEGKGSSDQLNTYSFVDYNIMGTAYYRLKQIDFDGMFTFSHVISVKAKKVKPLEVLAYPNPFTDELNLAISKDTEEAIEIMVYDQMGNHVLSISEEEKDGNFVKNIGDKFLNLPAGYYYANIIVGKEMERIKLMKN